VESCVLEAQRIHASLLFLELLLWEFLFCFSVMECFEIRYFVAQYY
jgi:hypothetical protein